MTARQQGSKAQRSVLMRSPSRGTRVLGSPSCCRDIIATFLQPNRCILWRNCRGRSGRPGGHRCSLPVSIFSLRGRAQTVKDYLVSPRLRKLSEDVHRRIRRLGQRTLINFRATKPGLPAIKVRNGHIVTHKIMIVHYGKEVYTYCHVQYSKGTIQDQHLMGLRESSK